MIKLTKDLNIVLPGDVYPTLLEKGAEVDGEVAEVAIAAGCAKAPKAEKAANVPSA
jgi:hypothetical protein